MSAARNSKLKFTGALAALLFSISAHAEPRIGVILYGQTGALNKITGGGHAGIYLSSICPAENNKLRKCNEGENGSVLARYLGFADGVDRDWMILPPTPHFYGVEKEEDIPLFTTPTASEVIKEAYRAKALKGSIPDPAPGASYTPGRWRDALGSMFTRSAHVVNLKITPEKEAELIESYNNDPNKTKFNFFLANCANFANDVLGVAIPGGDDTSLINRAKDFGMLSPKAVSAQAHSIGKREPEREMFFEKFRQLPGTEAPDKVSRYGMENANAQLKYAIPLVFAPNYFAAFTALSLVKRYNPEKESFKYPDLDTAALRLQISQLKQKKDSLKYICAECSSKMATSVNSDLEKQISDLERKLSTHIEEGKDSLDEVYESYQSNFKTLVDQALATHKISPQDAFLLKGGHPEKYFQKYQEPNATVVMDSQRGLLISLRDADGKTRTAGMAPSNIEKEDPLLGYQVMLGVLNWHINGPKSHRITSSELAKLWNLANRLNAASEPISK